jgi:hypothetical protein
MHQQTQVVAVEKKWSFVSTTGDGSSSFSSVR